MEATLEQTTKYETNAVFSGKDNRKCANCGKPVLGQGYKDKDGLVYHTRTEADYISFVLDDF